MRAWGPEVAKTETNAGQITTVNYEIALWQVQHLANELGGELYQRLMEWTQDYVHAEVDKIQCELENRVKEIEFALALLGWKWNKDFCR